jgi:hypothetical protein
MQLRNILKIYQKKKIKIEQCKVEGTIEEKHKEYYVDAEIGRFTFKTHRIIKDDKSAYDTSKDFFKPIMSKEYYRTEGFNEIALDFVTDLSYRKSSEKFNRIRWQTNNGTPCRTLANITEIEGDNVYNHIQELAANILKDKSFTPEGKPDNISILRPEMKELSLPKEIVEVALGDYNKGKDEKLTIEANKAQQFYENPETVVNISIDDVGVKKQKETGRTPEKLKKDGKEYVHNTIAHIESGGKSYLINAINTLAIIPLLIAFLLHNYLLRQPITFFVDGARDLQNAIFNGFSWLKSYRVILDWYHLKKKCQQELSLALKGKNHRNSVLSELLPALWLGKVDKAISILRGLNPDIIKSKDNIEKLIGYFNRNNEFIPCYALRKKLKLRVSSNKGEKANDLVVSNRQKNNGMSWSKDGSVALATIKTIHLNNEQNKWFSNTKIGFKFAA